MKIDIITSHWFNYKMATIELGDRPEKEVEENVLKSKFAIVTIHDVSPEYIIDKIYCMAKELEKFNVQYNFAMIPYPIRRKIMIAEIILN